MSKLLSRLWPFESAQSSSNGKVSAAPFTPELVMDQLSPYGLAEGELEHLSRVITTPKALNEMLASLRGNRQNMLGNQLTSLVDKWCSKHRDLRREILVVCQQMVGTEIVHPVFEPVTGLLKVLNGFDQLLLSRLERTDILFTEYTLAFDCNHDLVLIMRDRDKKYEYTYKLPFALATDESERDFWLRFARIMAQKVLLDAGDGSTFRRSENRRFGFDLICRADAGAFATFASRIAFSAMEAAEQAAAAPGQASAIHAAPEYKSDLDLGLAPMRSLTVAHVAEQLQPYGLAESERDYFARVIGDERTLSKMTSSLRSNCLITLERKADELSAQWAANKQEDARILLACQSLVGTAVVHPVFEPVAGLLNACGGFGQALTNIIGRSRSGQPVGTPLRVYFDAEQNLAIEVGPYYHRVLPFALAASRGEREFWILFARKMTEQLLTSKPSYGEGLICAADAGAFITFASHLAALKMPNA